MAQQEREVEFKSEDLKLSGTLFVVEKLCKGGVLILAGGGNFPHKEGYYPAWQRDMADHSISSFSFDYGGVGESEGKLDETNLISRLEDARNALKVLASNINAVRLFVVGISMGAPIASRLANESDVGGLILVSPAAYSEVARDKTFGPEFSEEIRREKSWKNSPDFNELLRFKGRVLLVYSRNDEIIPSEILETYDNIVRERGIILALETVSHGFIRETDPESRRAQRKFYNSFYNFVNDNNFNI